MTMRMLIDARHREETRVAVVKGTRIEEFDFESAERKQLKGNIYLAKVTRVEPSLQAAFVDYGGNRHGFLAFSEIHPDYYQIPREDREALLREEAEHAAAEAERVDEEGDDETEQADQDAEDAAPPPAQELSADDGDEESVERWDDDGGVEPDGAPAPKSEAVNGGEDQAAESLRKKRQNLRHRYKIQDVIHRRQVLLVQVVKEERGNKGAALTTYLSLAGRYCVLMPNTSHGGGISRKISNAADRKRLKAVMAELKLPSTMGCIVRTAGLQRSSDEIRRDFDYLARLWDEVRERTLTASAPALIHADSDLIKRAIRDIYNKDIDEVIVEGEEGYDQARAFMKLLSPTHAKKVKLYIDSVPLFQRGGVEDQLAAMYNPVVQLKSGGYLVINPTEALVSIDINSGRSTREYNIEQTALSTNLEAAAEIARQLRLRDMAGLIVIDFIDMEHHSNNRKVEKAIKDALKNDRARIQVGRISSFGLFEMSRQRLRTGVLEASTRICPHCDGTGLVRTASSAGLQALRMLEEEAARGRASQLRLRASQEAAFYVLNRKRGELAEIEDRYGVMIEVVPDGAQEGARMAIEAGGPPPSPAPRAYLPPARAPEPEEEPDEEEGDAEDVSTEQAEEADAGEGGASSGRRRRRRRRGGRPPETGETRPSIDEDEADRSEAVGADTIDAGELDREAAEPATADGGPSRRRRSRRGGRGRSRSSGGAAAAETATETSSPDNDAAGPNDAAAVDPAAIAPAQADGAQSSAAGAEPAPARSRSRRRPSARPREDAASASVVEAEAEAEAQPADDAAPAIVPAAAADPVEGASIVEAEGAATVADTASPDLAVEPAAPKTRRSRTKKTPEPAAETEPQAAPAPRRSRSRKAEPGDPAAAVDALPEGPTVMPPLQDEPGGIRSAQVAPNLAVVDDADPQSAEESGSDGSSPRRGWWQRTFGN